MSRTWTLKWSHGKPLPGIVEIFTPKVISVGYVLATSLLGAQVYERNADWNRGCLGVGMVDTRMIAQDGWK